MPYAWLVDLEARTVIVHRLEAGRWVTLGYYSDETEAWLEPFEAVPLNVAGWWRLRTPSRTSREQRWRTLEIRYHSRRNSMHATR